MPTSEITITGLTKTFGAVRAVDDLSFTVRPGRAPGFLGPNGSGKTTTLRMLLGLVEPTAGSALIGGRHYTELPQPARTVGAALEANSLHPGRTARGHLRVFAPQVDATDARVDEVLEVVGLTEAANRRVSGVSLGMRQRLGLATTLLGDPQVLVLDEPANGLDPHGISWLRLFLRHLAAEGRTVLVSSHVLGEVQQTVDDVVIIARGRLVHASTLDGSPPSASVRVPRAHPRPSTARADRAGPAVAHLRRSVPASWCTVPRPPRSVQWPSPNGSSCTGCPMTCSTSKTSSSDSPTRTGRPHERRDPHRAPELLSTRLWWILLIGMAAYMAFLAAVLGFALATGDSMTGSSGLSSAEITGSVYTLATALGYVFPLVVGALILTNEFRHQTATPTFLFEPRRHVVLAASSSSLA
ncbi:ATP-binding cassette domain-containing protein [Aeromicrobium sp. UC242_57]|uniref:ATP-binding cassette domain-containing protein n=1 Tax=Aeromicrobium sp. UC242_57 TaxID=3374624 RepID=UPI0037B52277